MKKDDKAIILSMFGIDKPSHKIFAAGALIGVVLLTLLGGLALVVRSLRNVNLTLFLDLKKDDTAEKKY